jgi:ATP-dependent DNA helicase RecQ
MKLGHMYRYCTAVGCRHKAIVHYFGQELSRDRCGACDFCLGELQGIAEALVTAQKILSSIVRQGERFGAEYTAAVLTGSREDRILANLHDRLSTYGLLAQHPRPVVREWIEQLADQECVERVGEYSVLRLTEKGRRVLKGLDTPVLTEPVRKKAVQKHAAAEDSWEGVDRGLFEVLRGVRRKLAQDRLLPAYIVFSDAALRDMARKRPLTPAAFLGVTGVGQAKLSRYGPAMLEAIRDYCRTARVTSAGSQGEK